MQGQHLLLTVLGKNPTRARYRLGEHETEADLATAALVQLLDKADRPDTVIALCTPEAWATAWPLLEEALKDLCQTRCCEIRIDPNPEGMAEYIRTVVQAIPHQPGTRLTLDLTHGFRHLPFLTYSAVLYLTALHNVELVAAYYGMLGMEDAAPFMDLRPLLELPQWFHAVQVLRSTGNTLPMADLLGKNTPIPATHDLAQELQHVSASYLAGLPLELGQVTNKILQYRRKVLPKNLTEKHRLPLADELSQQVFEWMGRFRITSASGGEGWKRKIPLDQDQLRLQARLIDDLLEREHISTAIGLMREWVCSWILWQQGQSAQWLDYASRRKADRLLSAMREVKDDPALRNLLTPEQDRFIEFYRQLTELRNTFHHHGMRGEDLLAAISQKKSQILDYWRDCLRNAPEFDFKFAEPEAGPLLISPIGLRPGVLFSALRAAERHADCRLARCLAICSRDSAQHIDEAVNQAGYPGDLAQRVLLEDEFGGTKELTPLVKQHRKDLLRADRVYVNVTGGTTLMGILAERFAGQARKFDREVLRFGLIDRRPPQQQDADPYQPGEPLWLDREEDDDHAD